jgi:CHAT domain-containing protein/tetratricopeptide (TPR) repeat protein
MTEESVTEPGPPDEVGARIDVVRLRALEGERHLREGLLEAASTLFRAALEGLVTLDEAARKVLAPPGMRGGVTEAGLHSGLGFAAFRSGDHRGALAAFERALRLDEASSLPLEAAKDLCNIGVVRRQLGDLDGALAAYERAAWLERHHGQDPVSVAITINNIGRVVRMRGELRSALDRFREAFDMIPDEPEHRATRIAVLNNIAGCHLDDGDLATAIDDYRQALDLTAGITADRSLRALCHNNLGYAYKIVADDRRALVEFENALRIDERVAPRSIGTARDLLNIAGVRRDAGDRGGAVEHYERARRMLEETAPESLEMATCLTDLGGIRHLDGDLQEALDLYTRALEIDEALGPESSDTGIDHNNIGDVLLRQGDLAEALEHLRLARRIHRAVSVESLDSVTAAHNLAVALWLNGDREEAVAELREAVDMVARLRARAGADWARESVLAQHEVAFADLVDWLYTTGAHADAFLVGERFRARVMLDLLSERRVDTATGDTAHNKLIDEERRLADRLATAFNRRRLAERAHDPEEAERAARLEHDVAEELDRIRRRIRTVHPAYAELRAPTPVGLETLRSGLHTDELVLSYLLTPQDSFVWAVRRDTAVLLCLDEPAGRLTSLVDEALGPYLEGRVRGERAQRELLATALLGPVPESLWTGVRQLTVVPDGALAYLPFEMLPFDDGTLVLDRLTVGYCPSATVFTELRRPGPRPGSWDDRQFVGYADPERPPGSAAGTASRLPGARREVARIADAFGSTAARYVGSEVTAERIAATAGGYRFVHFATHALIDDEDPLYSGLVVTPAARAETAETSGGGDLLHMYEMFRLRLSAEVVVCSACQSGVGPIRTGEGLVGMGRAFIAAGAGAVVLTSWPVGDAPTARLLRVFYERLRAGDRPAEALTTAKRQVRTSHARLYADPFTWAAFQLTGAD